MDSVSVILVNADSSSTLEEIDVEPTPIFDFAELDELSPGDVQRFLQVMATSWPQWHPAKQVVAALNADAEITDYEARKELFPRVVLEMSPQQPLLLSLTGLFGWDMSQPGTVLKQHRAWIDFQSVDLDSWADGDTGAIAVAQTGAIVSVYWSLDDRTEVLEMADGVLEMAVREHFGPLVHPLVSVILDAAVEVSTGPVGELGLGLMRKWQDTVRHSVHVRGPDNAFTETSLLKVWDSMN